MIIKLCGRELEFDQSIIDYNDIRLLFVEYMRSTVNEFSAYYKENIKNFDTLYEKGLTYYFQIVADSMKFVSEIMQRCGLYGDSSQIIQMISDNSDMNYIMKFYSDNVLELERAVQKINEHRAAKSVRRSRWQGGGFGITGALKGALTAGTLNMGSDMLHGLGKAIGSASDYAKLQGMKHDIYKGTNHLEMLLTGLENWCKDLLDITVNILVHKNILKQPKLDSMKAAITINKARDIVLHMTGQTPDLDYEKVIDLVCQGVVYDPYNLSYVYGILYIIPQTNKLEVLEFAKYFGMEDAYYAEKDKVVKYIMASISEIPEDTIPQIEKKIEEIKKIQKNYIDINFNDSLLKLKEKKHKMQQAEIEEAKRQAALAEAKEKAQVWEIRLEKDKKTTEMNINQVQKYLERKEIQSIWKMISTTNVFAEYMLQRYYEEAIAPAIDMVDAALFNQIASGIRLYAEQGILFARYLLSYVHMLFWSQGYGDYEKVNKMLCNCAKAADCGCISAMSLMTERLDESDTEFIPKLSKSWKEYLEIAAENQHPRAMWQYGTLCKKSAGDDLEKQAKADYFLKMSEYYGYTPPACKKEKNASACFITSAVCRTFNKPDDCYELTTFRAFRDNWLSNQSDGQALIQEYYRIAPVIVEQIDRQSNSKEIYQAIWDCYLTSCIELIELQQFEQCKNNYIIMVNRLKEKYLY